MSGFNLSSISRFDVCKSEVRKSTIFVKCFKNHSPVFQVVSHKKQKGSTRILFYCNRLLKNVPTNKIQDNAQSILDHVGRNGNQMWLVEKPNPKNGNFWLFEALLFDGLVTILTPRKKQVVKYIRGFEESQKRSNPLIPIDETQYKPTGEIKFEFSEGRENRHKLIVDEHKEWSENNGLRVVNGAGWGYHSYKGGN